MTSYNIVATTDDVTVVAEYSPEYRLKMKISSSCP